MYDFLRKTRITEKDVKNKLVLDVGCGNGRYSLSASELGAGQVIGIDLIPSVYKTHKRLKKRNVQCVQADIFNLPFYSIREYISPFIPEFKPQNIKNVNPECFFQDIMAFLDTS